MTTYRMNLSSTSIPLDSTLKFGRFAGRAAPFTYWTRATLTGGGGAAPSPALPATCPPPTWPGCYPGR
jgi:hypothetical protein